MWESRSRWLLAGSLAAALAVAGMFSLFLLRAVFHWRIAFHLIDGCAELFRRFGFPVAIALMMTLLSSSLALLAGTAADYAAKSWRWKRRMRQLADLPQAIALASRDPQLARRLTVLRLEAPVAMTFGLLRPRIVLSAGLLALLNQGELEAVVRHERHHMQKRDPLALFLLGLLKNAFWYLPIFDWVYDKFRMLAEAAADRHAIRSTGGAEALGGALLKLARRERPAVRGARVGASFAEETTIDVRIRLLLDPDYELPLRPPYLRLLLSAASLLLIALLS